MPDRALLVGIDAYAAVPPLRGCRADVADMADLLAGTVGFDPGGIETLLDDDATRANILDGLGRLASDARGGDRIAFHFSGHGSSTPDLSGDEGPDDALDELLVTADPIHWGDPRTFLLDDDLGRALAAFRAGVEVTATLDCCHSGTGTRELAPPPMAPGTARHHGARGARLDEKATAARAAAARLAAPVDRLPLHSPHLVLARFATPPLDVEDRARDKPRRSRTTRARKAVKPKANIVIWAACDPNQTAADLFVPRLGAFRGAFTEAYCRLLRESGPGVDQGDLLDRLAGAMAAARLAQVPQLERTEV